MPDPEDLKAVSYDKTGRIRAHICGVPHTLQPPDFGQFREIKDALNNVGQKVQAAVAERGIDLANPQPGDDMTGLDDLSLDYMAEAIRLVFNGHPDSRNLPTGLSDQPLPPDVDRWPAWLILDDNLLSAFIDHWRRIPLARS